MHMYLDTVWGNGSIVLLRSSKSQVLRSQNAKSVGGRRYLRFDEIDSSHVAAGSDLDGLKFRYSIIFLCGSENNHRIFYYRNTKSTECSIASLLLFAAVIYDAAESYEK